MANSVSYLNEAMRVIEELDSLVIDKIEQGLAALRARGGRLFILGNGGGAAHASHAAADFRNLCDIRAYCATDNAAFVTAQANDHGFHSVFGAWIQDEKVNTYDALLVLSVGGGSKTLSTGLSEALVYAVKHVVPVFGIVGRDGGVTAGLATACLIIPPLYPDRVTPHTEEIQSVVLHYLATALAVRKTAWESQR